MQKAVDDAKGGLDSGGVFIPMAIGSGGFRTDNNFSVRKGNDIRSRGVVEKSLMDRCDDSIRYDCDLNGGKSGEDRSRPTSARKTVGKSEVRHSLQYGELNPYLALAIGKLQENQAAGLASRRMPGVSFSSLRGYAMRE